MTASRLVCNRKTYKSVFVFTLFASALASVHSADVLKAYSDVDYQENGAAHLTWHVEVYDKTPRYLKECCGALVTPTVVLSAARCFWDKKGGQKSPTDFAVTNSFGSNLEKPWRFLPHTSNVIKIDISPLYRGDDLKSRDDIAILTLEKSITGAKVKPICVSFDPGLEEQQLKEGNYGRNIGTLQSYGYAKPSPLTTALEVPFIPQQQCMNISGAQPYLNENKICTGFKPDHRGRSESLVCRGNAGSGLAFYSGTSHSAVPYLRGITTVPFPEKGKSWAGCSTFPFSVYTRVSRQREFLERHIPGLEGVCKKYYGVEEETSSGGREYVCNCFCNNATNKGR